MRVLMGFSSPGFAPPCDVGQFSFRRRRTDQLRSGYPAGSGHRCAPSSAPTDGTLYSQKPVCSCLPGGISCQRCALTAQPTEQEDLIREAQAYYRPACGLRLRAFQRSQASELHCKVLEKTGATDDSSGPIGPPLHRYAGKHIVEIQVFHAEGPNSLLLKKDQHSGINQP
jgi:hypothetical protein